MRYHLELVIYLVSRILFVAVCFGWKFFFLVSGIGTLNEIFISIVLMIRNTVGA